MLVLNDAIISNLYLMFTAANIGIFIFLKIYSDCKTYLHILLFFSEAVFYQVLHLIFIINNNKFNILRLSQLLPRHYIKYNDLQILSVASVIQKGKQIYYIILQKIKIYLQYLLQNYMKLRVASHKKRMKIFT